MITKIVQMPPIQEETPYELSPPDSELTPPIPSPVDYSSLTESVNSSDVTESTQEAPPSTSAPFVYEEIYVPQEPTLKELVESATNCDDVTEATEVKLKVISRDVSLQHLSILTPQLRELILDGSVVSSLRDLGCGLKALKVLRVNNCSLKGLDGMFGLQSLEELHASKNSIKDVSPCSHLPNIQKIDVRRNILEGIDSLAFLILCPNLQHLYLEGNKNIDVIPTYRQTIKKLLPNVKTLDGAALIYEEGDNSSQSSTSNSFLPPITKAQKRPDTESKATSYVATFPPKILSPKSPPCDSPRDKQVKKLLPEINRPSSSLPRSGDSTSANHS